MACLEPVIDPAEVIIINPNITDTAFWIEAATALWNQIPESCRCQDTFDQDFVDLLGAYLAAHMGTVATPDVKQEEILKSDIRVNYNLATLGQGYMSTRYGQSLNMMMGGCLEQIGISSGQVVFSP